MKLFEGMFVAGHAHSSEYTRTIAARNFNEAVKFLERYAKKNYYNVKITSLKETRSIDIFYR